MKRVPAYVILSAILLGFVAGAWADNWATFRACATKGSATVFGGTMKCQPVEQGAQGDA